MTTKTNLWIYRTNLGSSLNARDIVGYDVHATDGDIGKIDDASTDTSRQYLVVDTGFWIFGKKRMIPAGHVIERIDRDANTVHVRNDQGPDQGRGRTSTRPRRTRKLDYDRFGTYYERYGW